MKSRQTLDAYFAGAAIIACGLAVWVMVSSWEWALVLGCMGVSSIVGRLWLRRRQEVARQRRYEEEGQF